MHVIRDPRLVAASLRKGEFWIPFTSQETSTHAVLQDRTSLPWPLESLDLLSDHFEQSLQPLVGNRSKDLSPSRVLVPSPGQFDCQGGLDNWQRMEKVFDLAMEPKTVRTCLPKTPIQIANMRRLRKLNGACQTHRPSKKAVCMGFPPRACLMLAKGRVLLSVVVHLLN